MFDGRTFLNINKEIQMATKEATKSKEVVLNNKTKATSYSKEVFDTLSAINQQREKWEVGVYKKSNDELYSILQSCYAVDWAIAHAEDGAAEMRKGITDYASKLGFSFKEGTPTMNKIVRCVFGNVKRSRISTYSLVLREAKRQKVAIDDIPQFIVNGGGVQEIRLSKSDTYKSPKQKAAVAQATAFADSIAVAKSSGLSKLADANFANTPCLLLATQHANGTFAIHSVVRSQSALTAALVSHYGATKTVLADVAKKGAAANDSIVRNDILRQIINK
jgi:hypothetical protein